MKKILAAGIVRVLEFDSIKEMYLYIGNLRHKKIRHKVNYQEDLEDGRVLLNITTAYNNTALIEKISLIEKTRDQDG